MTETYTTGVALLKQLTGTLQRKASTNLEQITSAISSQAMAVENVREGENSFCYIWLMKIVA